MSPPLQPARVQVSSNEVPRAPGDTRGQRARGGRASRGLTDMGFAAAYYIDGRQGRHMSLGSHFPAPRGDLDHTDELHRVVLDYMALILARFKGNTGDNTGNTIRTTATKNVTATLLEGDEQQTMWTLWIAKNGGPQEFNGMSDENFVSMLSKWFGRDTSVSDKQMEDRMTQFWEIRSKYHREYITESFNNIKACPPKALAHQYRKRIDNPFVDATFSLHFNLVQAIANNNQFLPDLENTPFGLPEHDQEYPRYFSFLDRPPTRLETAAECFRKLVKNTKRLYTVQMAMIAFRNFRNSLREKNITLTIKFVGSHSRYSISKEALSSGLSDLKDQVRPYIQQDPSISNAIQVHKDLDLLHHRLVNGSNDSTPLYFHCELKLLSKFKDNPAARKYIGCSKLSCYSCWEILSSSSANFTTKGSHGKFHWQCTFPESNLNVSVGELENFLIGEVRDSANGRPASQCHATSQSQTPPKIQILYPAEEDDIELETNGEVFVDDWTEMSREQFSEVEGIILSTNMIMDTKK